MNPAVIYLAILCVWPTDATQGPVLVHAESTSLAVCEAGLAAEKAKLEANPIVRSVDGWCIELKRGDKA